MKRAVLLFGLLLSSSTWADTVYFDTGRVWKSVKIVDTKPYTSGVLLLIESKTSATPSIISRSWYEGAIHIEFGDKPASPVLAFRSPHAPIIDVLKQTIDGITWHLSTGKSVRLLGVAPVPSDRVYRTGATSLVRRLGINKKAWIEFDRERTDRDGRLVGYVFLLPEGAFLNQAVIENGCGSISNEYPIRPIYYERLREAARRAGEPTEVRWNRTTSAEIKNNPGPPLWYGKSSLTPRVIPQTDYSEPSAGAILSEPSGEKTVHVKGYTRKDGTYVRPHTRRPPRQK